MRQQLLEALVEFLSCDFRCHSPHNVRDRQVLLAAVFFLAKHQPYLQAVLLQCQDQDAK